jgi:hypothetical protein
MERLVYCSRRVDDTDAAGFSPSFKEIGEVAAKNNVALNVTGFLLCTPTWYAQVLEGERDTLATLLVRLERDSRHLGMEILSSTKCKEKSFPAWGMGWRHQNISNRIHFLRHELVHDEPPRASQVNSILEVCHILAKDTGSSGDLVSG